MFKRILVSIPQEQFPELAIKRSRDLSERNGSRVYLTYVIEENVFDEVGKTATHIMSEKEQQKFEKKMTRTHEKVAKKVVLKACEKILCSKPEDFSIVKGRYSDTILEEIGDKEADMLLMEYESYNLMKYRIIHNSTVPVWIERHDRPVKSIGLFCTNLSPNEIAPKAASVLRRAFNAKIHAYYINDPEREINGDEPDEISELHRLKWDGVVNEKVDNFIYQKAKEESFDLIILGRIRKRGYFHLRSKFAKKTRSSILLVN